MIVFWSAELSLRVVWGHLSVYSVYKYKGMLFISLLIMIYLYI